MFKVIMKKLEKFMIGFVKIRDIANSTAPMINRFAIVNMPDYLAREKTGQKNLYVRDMPFYLIRCANVQAYHATS